jgi:hypothetical protein
MDEINSSIEKTETRLTSIKESTGYLNASARFHHAGKQKLEYQKEYGPVIGSKMLEDEGINKTYEEQGERFARYQEEIQGLEADLQGLREKEIDIDKAQIDRLETL